MTVSTADAEKLFKRLDVELGENIEDHYFQEPREFRCLIRAPCLRPWTLMDSICMQIVDSGPQSAE